MICGQLLVIYIFSIISILIKTISCEGFIIYCPCMGRFGNQAEQLLGSLLFAKSLNRTLVLPPFIYYGSSHGPTLIPFEDIIQVEPIQTYTNVVLLRDFMTRDAPQIWGPERRQFFCYSPRDSRSSNSCDALKGQPFNTFWSSFNISDSNKSIFYKPLTTDPRESETWINSYPSSEYSVIMFSSAPSSFPATKESIPIQKHIILSDLIVNAALEFKRRMHFLDKPYISMHIRHGPDWERACRLTLTEKELTRLFSSNQCTGYNYGAAKGDIIEHDTCLPSFEKITEKLHDAFKESGILNVSIVHIATDMNDDSLWRDLSVAFPHIKFIRNPLATKSMIDTMIDIYLMAHAEVFIGNCISSFSAFPARLRKEQMFPKRKTLYFGQKFDFQALTTDDEPRSEL